MTHKFWKRSPGPKGNAAALPKFVSALDELVDVEELVEVEEDARHVGDEEHADHAHQDHPQLQVLGLKQ